MQHGFERLITPEEGWKLIGDVSERVERRRRRKSTVGKDAGRTSQRGARRTITDGMALASGKEDGSTSPRGARRTITDGLALISGKDEGSSSTPWGRRTITDGLPLVSGKDDGSSSPRGRRATDGLPLGPGKDEGSGSTPWGRRTITDGLPLVSGKDEGSSSSPRSRRTITDGLALVSGKDEGNSSSPRGRRTFTDGLALVSGKDEGNSSSPRGRRTITDGLALVSGKDESSSPKGRRTITDGLALVSGKDERTPRGRRTITDGLLFSTGDSPESSSSLSNFRPMSGLHSAIQDPGDSPRSKLVREAMYDADLKDGSPVKHEVKDVSLKMRRSSTLTNAKEVVRGQRRTLSGADFLKDSGPRVRRTMTDFIDLREAKGRKSVTVQAGRRSHFAIEGKGRKRARGSILQLERLEGTLSPSGRPRRGSQGLRSVRDAERLQQEAAGEEASSQEDSMSEAESDSDESNSMYVGVHFGRQERRRRFTEAPTEHTIPTMTAVSKLLQEVKLFRSWSAVLLMQIGAHAEERLYKVGDDIWREGEKQSYLAILESGSASLLVGGSLAALGASAASEDRSPASPSGRNGAPSPTNPGSPSSVALAAVLGTNVGPASGAVKVAELGPGSIVGELQAFGVREQRSSTLHAMQDCKMWVLDGAAINATLEAYPAEAQELEAEMVRWRGFHAAPMIAALHPELAYQLRASLTTKVIHVNEEVTIGCDGAGGSLNRGGRFNKSSELEETGVVVETGQLSATVGGASPTIANTSSVVNENTILGLDQKVFLKGVADSSHCLLLRRSSFWTWLKQFPREREHFMKLTLERIPPCTNDISTCPVLTHLQGSAGFSRVVAGLTRQRVFHPGALIRKFGEDADSMLFIQRGSAEIHISGQKVREIGSGSVIGELNFLGIHDHAKSTVYAVGLCVVQELRKGDVELQFARHTSVRSRFRDLQKHKRSFWQDLGKEQRTKEMKIVRIFQDLAEPFLHDLMADLEDRLYFVDQVIISPDDAGDFMVIICDGFAATTDKAGRVRKLGPYDFAGEMELLCSGGDTRELVEAIDMCCIHSLHHSLLIKCLKRHPSEKTHFEVMARSVMVQQKAQNTKKDEGEQSNVYTLPFFKNCGVKFLYLLGLHLERHIFFCFESIVEEGTEGQDMYILYSGSASVHIKGTEVGSLQGGQCFGEMAVLGLVKKRTATIVARTLCDVRILKRSSLEEAIEDHSDERERFESLAAFRFREAREKDMGGKVRQTSLFFRGCGAGFAQAITEQMVDRLYVAGRVIMHEGDAGDWMFLLHRGKASVSLDDDELAVLSDGDVAGEMAMLGLSNQRTATIKAVEVCFAQVLERSTMLPLMNEYPKVFTALRVKAARRLENRFTDINFSDVPLFSDLSLAFEQYMEKHAEHWLFFSGDTIVKENSEGSRLILLLTGSAEVRKNGEVVGELNAGDVIGEMAMMRITDRRTTTVVCKDICKVYMLKRRVMEHALSKWPEQAPRMRSLAAARMRRDVSDSTQETFLMNCPMFKQCSSKFIQCISSHLEDQLFMPGENICTEGERGEHMFVVRQGTLECYMGGTKCSEFESGAIIGEIAVLGLSSTRTATLTAKTVSLVQVLHRPIFMKYLFEFPREMMQIQEVATTRLEHMPITAEANLFRKQHLFRDCCNEFLDRLDSSLKRKFYFPGQKIVKEGADSIEMYTVTRGRAAVERRGTAMGYIDEGHCFGEMAVLGVATQQLLSVKADTLCDTQVLVRWDLEDLLQEFPLERTRLLSAVALMMREEMADVTNAEILQEVPLLQEADDDVVQHLTDSVVIELARKDECLLDLGESKLIVLLDGTAAVEVGSVRLRELASGDSYGAASVLGLCGGFQLRVRALASCLTLTMTGDALKAAVSASSKTSRKHWKKMLAALNPGQYTPVRTLMGSPFFQHLGTEEEGVVEILQRCEQAVFVVEEEEVLTPSLQAQVMMFVLTGKARVEDQAAGSGGNSLILEQGSSIGEISAHTQNQLGSAVYALEPLRVLVLHRSSLFSIVDAWPSDRRERFYAKLESVPRQQRSGIRCISNDLQSRVESITGQCIQAAKMSLRASDRAAKRDKGQPGRLKESSKWNKAKMGLFMNKVFKGLMAPTPSRKLTLPRASRDGSVTPSRRSPRGSTAITDTPAVPKLKARVTDDEEAPPVVKKRLPVKTPKDIMDEQRVLLCGDLQRLAAAAKVNAELANRERDALRAEANALRRQYTVALQAEDELADTSVASSRATSHTPRRGRQAGVAKEADVESLRRSNAAAEKRIEQLRAKLEQVVAVRDELLSQLKPSTA